MSRPKGKSLEALEQQWYAVLKLDGFLDIEDTRFPDKPLIQYHSSYFMARYSPVAFENKRDYYTKASQLLHEKVFETEHDRIAWGLHCEGLSIVNIAKALDIKKSKVERILVKYKQVMLKRLDV